MSNRNVPIARRVLTQAGFDPSAQPDEFQLEQIRRAIATDSIPLPLVIRMLKAKNAPTQLRNTPFTYTDINGYTPGLLIPTNPDRLGFIIANPTYNANWYFSYGYPLPIQNVNISVPFLGIPISALSAYQESNGTISMDDLYAWSDTAGAILLGYESAFAFEGDT